MTLVKAVPELQQTDLLAPDQDHAKRCEYHYDVSKPRWYRCVMAPVGDDDGAATLVLHYVNENALSLIHI